MLKLIALLIVGAAHAQTPSYLVFPNQAACLARSQAMCAAMGCDGVHSKYWWDCATPLQSGTVGGNAVSAGSFAMRIDVGTPFDVTASNNVSNGTQGLTAGEQSSLVPRATMNTSTVSPWIISFPTFSGRLTPSVVTALNGTADSTLLSEWNTIKGAALVNLQAGNTIAMVNLAVADGIISSSNVPGILAPTLTQVPPQ